MITVKGLRKVFRTKQGEIQALRRLDLIVPEGEFFVLLGPSGSGKTTLMRCIAGLEDPDEGEIILGDEAVCAPARHIMLPPEQRGLGMVFQSYAIWPHMSVFDNVALPLTHGRLKLSREQVQRRVREALALVGMTGLELRPATVLSGGQQQRVALARALAIQPKVLLMDEPLSNLDARLREEVRTQIKDLVRRIGVTVLYVTHDQEEAMDIADKIGVMHEGDILQLGRAEEIYSRPVNPWVAQFFGSMNWLTGEIKAEGQVQTRLGLVCVRDHAAIRGQSVVLGVRPEDIQCFSEQPDIKVRSNLFPAEITSSTFLGGRRIYKLKIADETLTARLPASQSFEGKIYAYLPDDRISTFASMIEVPCAGELPAPANSSKQVE